MSLFDIQILFREDNKQLSLFKYFRKMIFYIQMKKVIKQRYFHFHLRIFFRHLARNTFKPSLAFRFRIWNKLNIAKETNCFLAETLKLVGVEIFFLLGVQ